MKTPKPKTKSRPKPEPEPEPEPEPPCKTLDEDCEAEATTLARLPNGTTAFSPPLGWSFAQGETETIVQLGAEGPVMVLSVYDLPKNPNKRIKARGTFAKKLSDVAGVDPGRGFESIFFRSGVKQEHAGIQMIMWQRNSGAVRADGKGIMVVFEGSIGDASLFGIAFVPESDTSIAEMILEALDTVIEVDPPPSDAEANDDKVEEEDEDEGKSDKGDGK